MKNLRKLLLFILVVSWTTVLPNHNILSQQGKHFSAKQDKGASSGLPPTMVYGVVTDCITGLPVIGVNVWAMETVQTNAAGYYEFFLDPGTYEILFTKLGYESMAEIGVNVVDGIPYELNICIYATPYPVQWVLAVPNEAETDCLVTWGEPMGAYEILYDDGSTEDYTNWSSPGGMVAVRFLPEGYPATITGGRIDVGDGSFPVGGNFLGTEVKISILDDDGPGGLPGTVLDSAILTVNTYGWVDFSNAFNSIIEDGDFYLAMTQLGPPENSAPIGANMDQPLALHSYEKAPGGSWMHNVNQDYMIRAYMFGANHVATTKNGENMDFFSNLPHLTTLKNRDIENYIVALVSNFDPCIGPETGTLTPLGSLSGSGYSDGGWASKLPGFYAYAVKVVYSSGESGWTYSNIVGHLMDAEVTVNVLLCDGGFAEGAEVSMYGLDCPFQMDLELTNSNGTAVFDSIIFGNYSLNISHVGYNPVMFEVNITHDTVIDVVLTQKFYPARNVMVNSVTNLATWDEPVITALEVQEFEGSYFPPQGWQSVTVGAGWFRSEDGGSAGFPVPSDVGYYAVTNSDLYPGFDASMDYLITPNIDLRESPSFALHFDYFFTMFNGETAYVEYSLDAGATWEVIETLQPVIVWTHATLDLSSFSGLNGESNIWFAFHYNNHNLNCSGLAIDNVSITNGPAEISGYRIYLDGGLVAENPVDARAYQFQNLYYGQTYQVGISPIYACSVEEPAVYSWTSGFLYPPRNVDDQYVDGTEEVPLMWNPPSEYGTKCLENVASIQNSNDLLFACEQTKLPDSLIDPPNGLINFRLYQNEIEIAQVPYEGQSIYDTIIYTVAGIDPGAYIFGVLAEYDLTSYGFPGEIGESLQDYTDTVHVVYGTTIPFDEGWDSGTFEFNGWQVSRSNWQITTIDGNPAPAAQFTGLPLLATNYSSTLTSYHLNADELTEGILYLDMDIKLNDKNATGLEMLDVEVYDGNLWHTVATFRNEGSFEFTPQHLDITAYTMSEVVKIRFNAYGQYSNDIDSWLVDNINVYRVCESVASLAVAEFNMESALLEWNAPIIPTKNFEFGPGRDEITSRNDDRQITGFNIYRKTDEMADYELFVFVPSEAGVEVYTYLDETTVTGNGYWYKVTCVWESETDHCESAPGYNVAMTEDYVYVLILDVNNPETEGISLFPNPATEKVNITSDAAINLVTMINYLGQVVYNVQLAGENSVVINTASYEAGIYIVQINTTNGVFTRRVVIAE